MHEPLNALRKTEPLKISYFLLLCMNNETYFLFFSNRMKINLLTDIKEEMLNGEEKKKALK